MPCDRLQSVSHGYLKDGTPYKFQGEFEVLTIFQVKFWPALLWGPGSIDVCDLSLDFQSLSQNFKALHLRSCASLLKKMPKRLF